MTITLTPLDALMILVSSIFLTLAVAGGIGARIAELQTERNMLRKRLLRYDPAPAERVPVGESEVRNE